MTSAATPDDALDLAIETAHQYAERTGTPWHVYRRTHIRDWRNTATPHAAGIIACDVLYFIQSAERAEKPNDAQLILEVQP